MSLPPLSTTASSQSKYPLWAIQKGIPLQEDTGGQYFEYQSIFVMRHYVYPVQRIEMVRSFNTFPANTSQRKAKKQNTRTVAGKTELDVHRQVETEEI